MLKKLIYFTFILCTSSYAFAKNTTLTIAPHVPSQWGYHNATIEVNQTPSIVNRGIVLTVSTQDDVALVKVAAMNIHPKIADSCRHIKLHKSARRLLFEMKLDQWIHCRYE